MSFIDIKDPKKSDAIVADYLATVKKIQQRNLNEGAQDLARQDDLQTIFNPVVAKELVPMREEIKTLNSQLAAEPRMRKSE